MRNILSHLRGVRLVLVIVVLLITVVGRCGPADAASFSSMEVAQSADPEPETPEPTDPPETESPEPDGTGEPAPEVADEPPAQFFCPVGTPSDDPEDPGSAGSESDPCYVQLVLTPGQLAQIHEGRDALTWAMAVLVFCGIVSAICIARGSRR